jgi:Ca2+-binding EF-hand superfamily protein
VSRFFCATFSELWVSLSVGNAYSVDQPVMKISQTVLLLAVLSSTSAFAQGPRGGKPPRNDARLIERFDTDGDGSLSEEERKAAREQMQGQRPPRGDRKVPPHGGPKDPERHKRMLERFDKDGDGELSEEEREEARKVLKSRLGDFGERKRKELIEKFDTDGDGKLSDAERAQARKAMERRRSQSAEYLKKAKQKMMLKFDADGDGELSSEEMQNAKTHFSEKVKGMRADLVAKYDTDGDGKLSEEERKNAHEAEKRKQLERFDRDGDGKLSEEERKAAFDTMLEEEPHKLMHMMLNKQKKGAHENGERPPHKRGPKQEKPKNDKQI